MEGEQISSTFRFENLTLKRGDMWRFKVKMYAEIPETFREFQMALSFNEKPFEKEIAYIERQMEQRKGENQLPFKGELKKDMKDFEAQIDQIKEDMEAKREDCPTIEGAVTIEQIKYVATREVDITMLIPSEIVGQISDVRNLLKDYKIELIRE